MEEHDVRMIVKMVISEMLDQDLIQKDDYVIAVEMINKHFKGEFNSDVYEAIKSLRGDKYYEVLPLYFQNGFTLEKLAEEFNCETSTISRNKKRLCMEVLRRVRKKR